MRLDLAMCRLRFVRTRSAARRPIEEGHLRINGVRVERISRDIAVGDVLTLPRETSVIIIRIEALPERRGPPAEARECYTVLDRAGTDPLAAAQDSNGAQG